MGTARVVDARGIAKSGVWSIFRRAKLCHLRKALAENMDLTPSSRLCSSPVVDVLFLDKRILTR